MTTTWTAQIAAAGISDTSVYAYPTTPFDPPDIALAVGTSYVVNAAGGQVQWTNITTGATGSESLLTLFAAAPDGTTAAPATTLEAPRLTYDAAAGLYVLVTPVFESSETDYDIATTTDPSTGTWTVATLQGPAGTYEYNFPSIAADGTNIYISALEAGNTTNTYVVPLTDVTGGNTIIPSTTAPPTGAFTSVGAAQGDFMGVSGTGVSGQTVTYMVAAGLDTTMPETIFAFQTYNPATQTYSALQSFDLGNADFGPTTTTALGAATVDYQAPQPGSADMLFAGAGNLVSVAFASIGGQDYLYGVSEVSATATTGSQPEFEWFQINVTDPTNVTPADIVRSGDISPASIGLDASDAIYNPSIAVDGQGDVLINFTASNATNLYASDYYIVAGASGTFGNATQYAAGSAPLEDATNSLGNEPFGAYSAAVGTATGFYISNEYVTSAVIPPNGLGGGWWETATDVVSANAVVAPAAPVISSPSNGSTDATTATPAISGTGVTGDTITLSIDGAAAVTALVTSARTWSYTPTAPLSEGSHTVTATQAATGGPSSTAATDTFTVAIPAPTVTLSTGPESSNLANQTISGAVTTTSAATIIGQTVTFTDNGVALTPSAPVTVQADGTFTAHIVLPQVGANKLVASVIDSYGLVGSSAPLVDTLTAPPTITGTQSTVTTANEAPVDPFAGVTITDPNASATDTLTITLSGGGGTLAGTGLTVSGGAYTLAGTATTITNELNVLMFTPNAGPAGGASATNFTLSDLSSAYASPTVDATTSVVDSDPLSRMAHANDLAMSASVTGSNNLIDLVNLEASYGDLISAFGTNEQAMQNWYNAREPIEQRPDTFDGLDYVASYSDLIAAFKGAGSEQAVLDAGATHFITYGVNEGRATTFNGLDYIASYGDLIKAFGVNGDAGALHYIEYGASEGRTTTFDGLDYIASYGDLAKAFGANEQAGAAHFIQYGYSEGRATTFDGLDYIAGYTDLMKAFGANNDAGATHYIDYGLGEGRTADAFNVAAYESAHTDLIGKYANDDAFLTAYINTYATTGKILT